MKCAGTLTRTPRKTAAEPIEDPAFGIWRDREDMTDVEAYLRRIRAPRYGRDGG